MHRSIYKTTRARSCPEYPTRVVTAPQHREHELRNSSQRLIIARLPGTGFNFTVQFAISSTTRSPPSGSPLRGFTVGPAVCCAVGSHGVGPRLRPVGRRRIARALLCHDTAPCTQIRGAGKLQLPSTRSLAHSKLNVRKWVGWRGMRRGSWCSH